jgi:hypothetical protein
MEYDNRQYVIFSTSELDSIDFTQVLETSAETVRRSVDGTKTFVKWEGNVPSSVVALTTKSEYLTYEEIMSIMATEEWTAPMEEVSGS